jgi:hypothetical protein
VASVSTRQYPQHRKYEGITTTYKSNVVRVQRADALMRLQCPLPRLEWGYDRVSVGSHVRRRSIPIPIGNSCAGRGPPDSTVEDPKLVVLTACLRSYGRNVTLIPLPAESEYPSIILWVIGRAPRTEVSKGSVFEYYIIHNSIGDRMVYIIAYSARGKERSPPERPSRHVPQF